MSKDKIPLLAHEKIKLAFWIVVIVRNSCIFNRTPRYRSMKTRVFGNC